MNILSFVKPLICAGLVGSVFLLSACGGPQAKGGSTTTPQEPAVKPLDVTQKQFGHPAIDSGQKDYHGNSRDVSCATCHTTREPNLKNKQSKDLDEFHQGLQFAHGDLNCMSCHNAEDYTKLKRADGTALEFSKSQQLCSQCHGPQARDYANGLHGGMMGSWKTKGKKVRHSCIVCHDPHHPAYPLLSPEAPPRDARENAAKGGHHHD